MSIYSEGGSYGTSILGNIRSGEFQLGRGITSIFKTGAAQASGAVRNIHRKNNNEVNTSITAACSSLC